MCGARFTRAFARRCRGTAARPRLAVFRSLNHIYAQVIDDEKGVTLCSASTVGRRRAGVQGGGNIDGGQSDRPPDRGARQGAKGSPQSSSIAAATSITVASSRWPRRRARPGCSSDVSGEKMWRV